ncbi:acyloxyacyl hydrolase-like isoform X3 [Haliotis cracherodii]|uniref:acyloxyacyl hydrolase-like isoform X3 n=1 Tax=Haliotis cracherodii TaxID=6455 RepID=UPI0039E785F5
MTTRCTGPSISIHGSYIGQNIAKMGRELTVCVVVLGVLCCLSGVAASGARGPGYRSINGGSNCAACTVVISLVEQLSEIYNETTVQALDRLCSFLPTKFQNACKAFANFVGPVLPEFISKEENPDTICHALPFCHTDPGHQRCQAYPSPSTGFEFGVRKRREVMKQHGLSVEKADICNLPGIKEICDYIDNIFDKHDPGVDVDTDGFSTVETLRGTSWRGRDCDDSNGDRHPGARPVMNDVAFDSNCNGIYGSDPTSGKTYEEVLCGGTEQRGVAVLGDSISAHFHLPEEWMDARKLSFDVFKHLPFILENEIDWPQMSSATGHGNNSWPEVIQGPIDSLYLRLAARNRCNHRDYQNIAVNGADSGSMLGIQKSLSRNPVKDQPLLTLYALVGNDVCNGHEDTFADMTTPAEMRNHTMTTLAYLDKVLPMHSHVLLIGLADARILYNSLHDRIHPLGRYRNDFTYSMLYDFLNCLDVSPCRGWLQTNETIRNMTAVRAAELSNVLKDIATTEKSAFSSFNVTYMDCPFEQVLNQWKKQGGEPWQLIEPVDGFHANQQGQALIAAAVWEAIEQTSPAALGQLNPNNANIQKIFGNQGGY